MVDKNLHIILDWLENRIVSVMKDINYSDFERSFLTYRKSAYLEVLNYIREHFKDSV